MQEGRQPTLVHGRHALGRTRLRRRRAPARLVPERPRSMGWLLGPCSVTPSPTKVTHTPRNSGSGAFSFTHPCECLTRVAVGSTISPFHPIRPKCTPALT